MDRKIIDAIAAAWQEAVSEKKKLDPVGKADADIDNDGDVDKSDDYLHNRRKAIKKAMNKEAKMCPKCDGKGCEHCDGKGTHEAYESACGLKASKKHKVKEDDDPCWDSHKMVGMKKKGGKMVPNCVPKEAVMHDEYGYGEILSENEDGTVDALFDTEVKKNIPAEELQTVSEKLGLPKKSGHGKSDHEGLNDKGMSSKAARDMLATVSKDRDDREEKSHEDATKAGRATAKQAPVRRGDNRKGDTKIINPVPGAVTSTTGKEGAY